MSSSKKKEDKALRQLKRRIRKDLAFCHMLGKTMTLTRAVPGPVPIPRPKRVSLPDPMASAPNLEPLLREPIPDPMMHEELLEN